MVEKKKATQKKKTPKIITSEAMKKMEKSPSKVVDFNKFSCNIGNSISVTKTFPESMTHMVGVWNRDIVHRLAIWACQEKLKKEVRSWIKSGLSTEELKKKVRYWKPSF